MRAMVLERAGEPLHEADLATPVPQRGQVALRVEACGVCRTDVHILDGELAAPKLPLVPGHQIVGRVTALGADVETPTVGTRVGVPWLAWTCGECRFCRAGAENLCDRARFTGYDVDGGFAESAVCDSRYCFPIPADYPAARAAPLLCAGLIGYRSLRLAGDASRIGMYGFGAAAHIVTQIALAESREVLAFVSPGDTEAASFARDVGASWAGPSDRPGPQELDAAILFAPVGALVPAALAAVRKGGTVVCAGIHMSDIPSFAYELLWGERIIRSVANLTRRDGEEFLALAPRIGVQTDVEVHQLVRANEALARVRDGTVRGAAVIEVAGGESG
ncbi:MAG: zinc-dependent alcohol dehydrogenase family protein [Gaiellales bacterium]